MKINVKILSAVIFVLIFSFSFPRFLIATFGKDSPWTSYLYMYGLGGVCFAIGIWLILQTRACQIGRGHDTFWFKVLLGGYLFFASLHGFWVWFSLSYPVIGG